jgi:two-component system, NarL family, sensor histidine kinase UhpB
VIYRVAQEALTNVVRHAGAARAWVSLDAHDGHVELEVGDTGAGFEPGGVHEGRGLLGMRERALLIGAELELGSGLGHGTSVRLRLADRS